MKKKRLIQIKPGQNYNIYLNDLEYDVYHGETGKEVYVSTPEAVFEIQLSNQQPGTGCQADSASSQS